jgi:hypothetical protein
VNAADAAALDEAGAFEDAEMAGNGGWGDAEGLGKEGDGNFAALAEADEDRAAGGIGESGEDGVDGAGMINHRVKYRRAGKEVKEYLTVVLSVRAGLRGWSRGCDGVEGAWGFLTQRPQGFEHGEEAKGCGVRVETD